MTLKYLTIIVSSVRLSTIGKGLFVMSAHNATLKVSVRRSLSSKKYDAKQISALSSYSKSLNNRLNCIQSNSKNRNVSA